MSISVAREAIAAACGAIEDFQIEPRPTQGLFSTPVSRTGAVAIKEIVPGGSFGAAVTVSFGVVVLLSSDIETSDALYEEHAVEFIQAISAVEGAYGVQAQPADFGSIYGMEITLKMEVA